MNDESTEIEVIYSNGSRYIKADDVISWIADNAKNVPPNIRAVLNEMIAKLATIKPAK